MRNQLIFHDKLSPVIDKLSRVSKKSSEVLDKYTRVIEKPPGVLDNFTKLIEKANRRLAKSPSLKDITDSSPYQVDNLYQLSNEQ
ncbi:hypothetical protein [Sporosarcina sp. A2]|uniref:hypothetical protein n=1 Tax=Sporosarcina sp. A2 TaxID=3393449 RepID=UPI003D79F811